MSKKKNHLKFTHTQEKSVSPYVLDLREIALKKQEEALKAQYTQEQEKLKAHFQEWAELHQDIHEEQEKKSQETIEDDPLLDILQGKKQADVIENLASPGKSVISATPQASQAMVYPLHPLKDAYIDMKKYMRYMAIHVLPHYHPTVASLKAKRRRIQTKQVGIQAFILLLVLVFPLFSIHYFNAFVDRQGQVKSQVMSAVDSVMAAKEEVKSFQIQEVKSHLEGAYQHLMAASSQVPDLNPVLSAIASFIPYYGPQYVSAVSLLKGSEQITQSAQYIATGIALMQENSDIPLTDRLQQASQQFEQAQIYLTQAKNKLADVQIDALPEEYQSQAQELLSSLPTLEGGLDVYQQYVKVLIPLLGSDQFRRYLIVFENRNELRPTGGFMGSFALVDIDQGKIKNIEIPEGGTYDVKGGLTTLVQSPDELRLVNHAWQMQDANWFADFPESARKIMWFYEKSGGPTVDGVIVITSKAAAELIGYFKEIEMPEYNRVVTKQNFEYILQREIEIEAVDKTKPKKIIADLVPKIIDNIFSLQPTELPALTQVLLAQLHEKQILLYTSLPEAQQELEALNWAGHIPAYEKDYLSVVHTNVAGGKTDGVIQNEIETQLQVSENGHLQKTVTIKRQHNGKEGDVFTGVKNIDYVRIFVPKGSKLISASGFEKPAESLFMPYEEGFTMDADLQRIEGHYVMDETSGVKIIQHPKATVFGHWMQTDVGETSQASITYELPFTLEFQEQAEGKVASYTQLFQKQPGIDEVMYQMTLKLPEHMDIVWSYPNAFTSLNDHSYIYTNSLTSDMLFGVVIE